MALFAANMKTNGKIHRINRDAADAKGAPREQHRMRCGWQIKKSTSVVFLCSRVGWGELCMKCFPYRDEKQEDGCPVEDPIEKVED